MSVTRYFVTVTAGLEQVAWHECARVLPGVRLLGFAHRCVHIAYPGSAEDLLRLRSVDDVFVFIGELQAIGSTRAALSDLRDQVAQYNLDPALAVCRSVRSFGDPPSYSITASFVGARNYSRYEIAHAVSQAVAASYAWHYIENTPENHAEHDLDLRVILEGEEGLVGLRLAAHPLHRRRYKVLSRPGSLKASVAYAMAFLAELQPHELVLDPCCGVATIAIEAGRCVHPRAVLASDINPEALKAAQTNARESAFAPLLFRADATCLPLPNASVDVVLSNLPFGRQVAVEGDLSANYSAILQELARILRPNGRAALLTDGGSAFMQALQTTPCLRLVAAHQISLFGAHPHIYLLRRLA
jgi:Predicted N6-adenine-specific DNA methylase